jgi:anti-sigma B factor antagonist
LLSLCAYVSFQPCFSSFSVTHRLDFININNREIFWRPSMTISERKSGDVTILDVEGKILLGEGDVQLKRKIDELIERNEKLLLLNLANVPYMDSGGLGEVVRSYTTVKRAGGDLKLVNATKRISDLLTITKLITVFEVFDDEASAVGSFA